MQVMRGVFECVLISRWLVVFDFVPMKRFNLMYLSLMLHVNFMGLVEPVYIVQCINTSSSFLFER